MVPLVDVVMKLVVGDVVSNVVVPDVDVVVSVVVPLVVVVVAVV